MFLSVGVRSLAAACLILPGLFGPLQAQPAPEAEPQMLERFSTPQGAYEVHLIRASQEAYRFEIRWQGPSGPPATYALPIPASDGQVQPDQASLVWGADPEARAWSTGSEEGYAGIAVRLVGLDRTTTGLVVTQRYGFEHLKRQHRVLVPRKGRLVSVWEYAEGSGPTWSAVVVPNGLPAGRLLVLKGTLGEVGSTQADHLAATRMTWHGATCRFRTTSWPGKVLKLVRAGDFPSPGAARTFLETTGAPCFQGFWVVDGTSLPNLRKGRSVLVSLQGTTEAAEATLQRVSTCGSGLPVRVDDF